MPSTLAARSLLALALLATTALATPAFADSVGTAGAANKTSSGTPPGGSSRVIEIGAQVVRNEKIETSPSGSVQLLFIDKTSLNIGPNSTIVIDEFVYNPVDSTGKLAITMGRGVLRVVGGQATHTGGATITTPAAAIGIRGGIATIKVDKSGTRAINNFGSMTMSSGGTVQPVRMGFVGSSAGAGAPPAAPVRVTGAEISGDTAATTSKPGQAGGTSKTPTDSQAVKVGLGQANAPLDITAPPKAGPGAPARAVASAIRAINPAGTNVALASQTAAVASLVKTDAPIPVVTPPPPPPVARPLAAAAFLLTTTAGAGSNVPFLQASAVTTGGVSITPVLGYRAGGSTTDNPNPARIFQASIGVSGQGTSQNSFLSVMTGIIGSPLQGTVQGGGFRAVTSVLSGTATRDRRSSGQVSSTVNPAAALSPITLDANGLPTGSYTTSQNGISFSTSQNIVNATQETASNAASGSSVSYGFDQTVTRGATPAGLGANRPTLALNGFAAGTAYTKTTNLATGSAVNGPAYIVTNLAGAPGAVSISLDNASSRVSAQFHVAGNGGPNTLSTANFRFGESSATGLNSARGAYVDLSNFAARSEAAFGISNGSSTNTETSSVNGVVLNSTANGGDSSGLIMVNANSLNPASLFPGVAFCNCSYTQWGFWSAQTSRSDATSSYSDRTGIATWVAGVPSGAADIQNAVTANTQATYLGHAVASISNNGAQYLAASTFAAAVDFGKRSATVGIVNLDGYIYAANVVNVTPTVAGTFVGTLPGTPLSGTGAPASLKLTGAFFQSPTDKIGEIGGHFVISHTTNPNYLGAGIIAGARQ